MNIKYHNKVEIFVGDKYYVSYNKVLKSIYSKIANLEPYADYIALGSGKLEVSENDTKLGGFVKSVPLVTSEIACDPKNSVYYVKKIATIDSNDNTSFIFSEVGITDSSESNPDIYNHILIKDETGSVIDVQKNAGESLTIKITLFLDLSSTDNYFLTYGDNNLIKLLLGEKLSDKQMYAVRGYNMKPNESGDRVYPRYDKVYKVNTSIISNSDGSYNLVFNAKLDAGAAREVVFLIGDSVVARCNIMNVREPKNISVSKTANDENRFVLDECVKDIVSITDSTLSIVGQYNETKVATSLGDDINIGSFSELSDNTRKFKSIDGSMVAFLLSDRLVMYRESEYGLSTIHTNSVDVNGLYDLKITENNLVIFKNVEPYIEIYKIIDNVCVKQNFYKANYDQSTYSYDYSQVGVIELGNGNLVIGVIQRSNNVGLVLRASYGDNAYSLIEIVPSDLSAVEKIIEVKRTDKSDAKLLFITSIHSNQIIPEAMEIYDTNDSGLCNYSVARDFMQADYITSHGDYVLVHTSTSPYVSAYDTISFNRCSFDTDKITQDMLASSNCDYLYGLWNDGKVHMFLRIDQSNILDFNCEYLNSLTISNIDNIVLLNKGLIVVSGNTLEYVLFDCNISMIKNLPTKNSSYNISYNKYSLLGENEFEGVQVTINFSL